jgi:hypothetical protein
MGSLKRGNTMENGEQKRNGEFHHHVPSNILMSFLAANPSIEYIRYQWLDYSGILRVRNVTQRPLSVSRHEQETDYDSTLCTHNLGQQHHVQWAADWQ